MPGNDALFPFILAGISAILGWVGKHFASLATLRATKRTADAGADRAEIDNLREWRGMHFELSDKYDHLQREFIALRDDFAQVKRAHQDCEDMRADMGADVDRLKQQVREATVKSDYLESELRRITTKLGESGHSHLLATIVAAFYVGHLLLSSL